MTAPRRNETGERSEAAAPALLAPTLIFIALVVAAIGSLGAPLITAVAVEHRVSLAAAQWTLTSTLLAGAVATPLLGRLGTGGRRRTTILATLAVVLAGSVLTVLPTPFWCVLLGRALQGVGLGLTALMMGVARDHLPAERSRRVIAMISVASTVGIGVGYPLAGFLTDAAGLHAAYAIGLVVSALALAGAWAAIPAARVGKAARLDLPGAFLLSAGLLAILIDASQTSLWATRPGTAVAVGAVGVLLLAGWARRDLRTDQPLVGLRLLRHRPVAVANLAMALAGLGMYLLLALATRYAQTPTSAGYGFGLSTFWAGLALVPFSLAGFVAGTAAPRTAARLSPRGILTVGGAVVLAAFAVFLAVRGNLVGLLVALAVLGYGVSTFSAAMPQIILAATPAAETSAAMAFNQVVRSVFFSFGSAIAGLVLQAHTPEGLEFPAESGYATAAVIGIVVMIATVATVTGLLRAEDRRSP
ncbi:MFS transporter [Pseudonocardia sp. DLS-67]